MSHCWCSAYVFFVFLIRHPVPAPASHRLLQVWTLMRLSAATNSCRHFSPSPGNRPDCFVSCHVTPVIVYFPRRTGSKMTVCMIARPPSSDFLLYPPPPLHFPHLLTPTAPFTDSADQSQFVCVCDPKLCLHVRSVWICMCVFTQNGCCVSVCELSLEAIFVALPPCCVCRTLKLSLGNEKWSLIWLLSLPPLPAPFFTLPTRCSWSVSSSLLQRNCK